MENNKIDDGGSAFPHQELIQRILGGDGRMCDRVYHAQSGMSLRDWFAGMALQGFATNNGTDTPDGTLAAWSYNMADAMLAARKESELETESRKLEIELNEMRSLFTSYVLCEEAWRNELPANKVNAVMEANFMREKAKQLLKL